MKQTAVEWLFEQYVNKGIITLEDIEQAKEMEKEQKGYSEEEVLQLLLRLKQTESYDNLYDWFEQFKKK